MPSDDCLDEKVVEGVFVGGHVGLGSGRGVSVDEGDCAAGQDGEGADDFVLFLRGDHVSLLVLALCLGSLLDGGDKLGIIWEELEALQELLIGCEVGIEIASEYDMELGLTVTESTDGLLEAGLLFCILALAGADMSVDEDDVVDQQEGSLAVPVHGLLLCRVEHGIG